MDVRTSTIDIPTPDGVADAILAAPADAGPHPGVLFYMDAFGLRPRLEEMAARIAGEGYVVLVPNVFYRSGRAPVVDLDDLSRPENRATIFEKLGPLMAALTPELAMRDAAAYLEFLGADGRVSAGPVGTVGYCMGGALALRTAALAPERVGAVASFHAGRLATDAPDSPHRSFGSISGEVYVAHADHDGSMPSEQQDLVERTLTEACVTHRAELYDGASHGFTMSDTAAYAEAATERHWDNLFPLFARTLRP